MGMWKVPMTTLASGMDLHVMLSKLGAEVILPVGGAISGSPSTVLQAPAPAARHSCCCAPQHLGDTTTVTMLAASIARTGARRPNTTFLRFDWPMQLAVSH